VSPRAWGGSLRILHNISTLDLVKMLPLLLSLENLHQDLWNQAKVTSESTYGAGLGH
jgi:hypothetical protein